MNILLLLIFGVVIKFSAAIALFNILSSTDKTPSQAASEMKRDVNYFDFFLWLISLIFWIGVIYLVRLIFS